MSSTFFWAKNPMHHRLHNLDEKLPMTLIFGKKSWVEEFPAEKVKEKRGERSGYVKSHVNFDYCYAMLVLVKLLILFF